MSLHRLVACALVGVPLFTLAQPAPEGAPPAPAAAHPFTGRGKTVAVSELRSGPDRLASVRSSVAAGEDVDLAPDETRGFVRVRLASGDSGYLPASAVERVEAAAPGSVAGTPAVGPVRSPSASAPGSAPEVPGRSVVSVEAGVALPRSDDLEAYDRGAAVVLSLSKRASRYVALEVASGVLGLSGRGGGTDPDYGYAYTFSSDVRAVPLLLGLRLVVPAGRAEVSALAGVGVLFVSADLEQFVDGFEPRAESDSATPLATQLGVGAAMRVTPAVQLEVGLRYLLGKADLFGETFRLDTMLLTGGIGF